MQQSRSYFTPTIISTNCGFTGECFSNGSLGTNDCNVSYTTNPTYMNMNSTEIISPLNAQFEIRELSFDTVYYFEFTVSVNETLQVSSRISERTMSGT